jgi:hypothetical protein
VAEGGVGQIFMVNLPRVQARNTDKVERDCALLYPTLPGGGRIHKQWPGGQGQGQRLRS